MLALVIGATGKTGLAVTRALAARGVEVRAGIHSSRATEAAYAAGATETAELDLVTGSGLEAAFAGVQAVYHLAPNVHPDEAGMARSMVDAAARAGVTRFAYHSVLHPDDTSMPHHLRKAEAEAIIRAREPGSTILRPAAYHQNLLDAARGGRIAVPYSLDAPFSNVDLEDVAEVAAMVLTDPGHAGRTYELAGPEILTVRDLAEIASAMLGRDVEAVMVPLDEWAAGPGASLSEQARDALMAMFRAYEREGLVGDPSVLARLLGRPPMTWGAALERGGR